MTTTPRSERSPASGEGGAYPFGHPQPASAAPGPPRSARRDDFLEELRSYHDGDGYQRASAIRVTDHSVAFAYDTRLIVAMLIEVVQWQGIDRA